MLHVSSQPAYIHCAGVGSLPDRCGANIYCYVAACHAEVVVFDGVAYHQSTSGVKVLKGDERTPFMSVTLFDKQKCKQVSGLPCLGDAAGAGSAWGTFVVRAGEVCH
jgi:hypothetical protein